MLALASVCPCVHTCSRAHVSSCTRVLVHTCPRAHVCSCTQACVFARVSVRVCEFARVCAYVRECRTIAYVCALTVRARTLCRCARVCSTVRVSTRAFFLGCATVPDYRQFDKNQKVANNSLCNKDIVNLFVFQLRT